MCLKCRLLPQHHTRRPQCLCDLCLGLPVGAVAAGCSLHGLPGSVSAGWPVAGLSSCSSSFAANHNPETASACVPAATGTTHRCGHACPWPAAMHVPSMQLPSTQLNKGHAKPPIHTRQHLFRCLEHKTHTKQVDDKMKNCPRPPPSPTFLDSACCALRAASASSSASRAAAAASAASAASAAATCWASA